MSDPYSMTKQVLRNIVEEISTARGGKKRVKLLAELEAIARSWRVVSEEQPSKKRR